MAVRTFGLRNVVLNLLFILVGVTSSKLNVPRVLLPVFNDFATNFVLEATEGGCYKWSTTRNDIIQITPLEEDPELQCSMKVVVSTITKEAARNIAVVLAEDVYTKQTLRCDVIVDVIHSLSISTTTRELFMEEAPEDFEVKAFDDQDNEFSTLEGIEFEWKIVPLGPNKDVVLRYITFRDSPYETPPAIAPLESQGKKGYAILFEGVKSGAAKVVVRLPHPEYKHIEAHEVQLMIVANLLITPPEVHVMPGDVVPFKIFFLNSGRMEEVMLPDKQYYLEAEDPEVASSNKKSGSVVALKEGKTRIVLRDKNVGKDDPALKLPAATMHVVRPDYLVINVLPHKNWAVMVGDHHDIVAELYSSSDHKLFIGTSVHINIEVAPEFTVISRTVNGSWLTGYGIKSSIVNVVATLEDVFHEKTGKVTFDNPITAKGDLMIYPRISLAPSEVILPWDPITRPKYDIDLVARGGDGRFLWTSNDHSIGLVSQTGHARTHSNGFFEVSAVMLRNHHNRQSAKFMILPPSRLEIVEFVMENEEKDGMTIQLPFTKCQELPFHIKQTDLKFRQNKTSVLPTVGISCGNIAMTALEVGTSKVPSSLVPVAAEASFLHLRTGKLPLTLLLRALARVRKVIAPENKVTLTNLAPLCIAGVRGIATPVNKVALTNLASPCITVSYFQDGRALEDSVTVSSYNPLRLVEPRHDVVLAVGTSINLVYMGGPRPVLGRATDHQKVVVSEDETVATATDVTQFYTIPAEDFSVVQTQTSSITTRITCGKPRKVTLQPELRVADIDACPMDLSSGNVVVQSTKNIDLEVAVFDDCGTRFLNISSFILDWVLKPYGTGNLLNKNGVFPKNSTIGNVPIAMKSYQTLEPSVDVGDLEINVTITGYNSKVLKKYSISPEYPPFMTEEDGGSDLPPVRATLALYLVDNTVITPNVVTLFNHPGNKQVVSVKQGSGYFELALSADDIAAVRYTESSKEIEIAPTKSGELTVQVIDLCLVSRPATLLVSVVSVGIVRVDMPDKVEIGKCIPAIVRLYDENDNLMSIPDPNMIDLRPDFENKIANIQRTEEAATESWGVGEIHYTITGVVLGESKLVFTVSGADEDIHSAPVDFQLNIKGGPQPDTNVKFDVLTPAVARVSDRGVLTATAVGTTKILAQSIGIHPTTGQSVIYSEDMIEVQVVELKGIRLMGPLTRFRVGATAPFWVWGLPDVSPMILGSLQDPPIFFKWSVDDKLLADLSGVFHPIGVRGKTRLFVNATVPGPAAGKGNVESVMLSSYLDIEVITKLKLEYPEFPAKSLAMAPFSQVQLRTNLDSVATKMTYCVNAGKDSPIPAADSDGLISHPRLQQKPIPVHHSSCWWTIFASWLCLLRYADSASETPSYYVFYSFVYDIVSGYASGAAWLPGDRAPSTEVLADKSVTSSDTIVTVNSEGLLQSHGILGDALLIVIATDDQGLKQRLSIAVQVKPIHYMSLNVIANWRIHSDTPLRTIPLGTEFVLKASFHDNVGNKFHAGPQSLKVKTSRCDLIKMEEMPGEAA
ncbi:hypothetical protein NQ318_004065 [Aromia moschata]|uniref:Nuclear pore membrane glycoprotein 210 n=1 Tax=Aromia moschata TaxID=1265417 RepID=A0AAV8Z9L0_9CUCU|nr:hypothetical protein NQ318_004065 [Aromia moschata]